MKENEQKHYLIYQITNLINGKIYIGKHETFNIEDNYFGSGKYLLNSINKHGLENFEFKILIDLKSREEMNLLEKMVVTEEFCKRDDVYNIKVGGDGGWDHVRWSLMPLEKRLHRRKKISEAIVGTKFSDERKKIHSLGLKRAYKEDPFKCGMLGKSHNEQSKQKMRLAHLGTKNNQYGKMWICNDLTRESRSILKTDPIPDGWRKGRICK